ncbi:hypothetical protein EFS14_10185, partial [Lentilactobacillus buchneri]|nr:hypothetical protein [Lentilactobacillus buchneri]
VRFSSSYKKSSNHQVIRTPIFCSPTTVDEEPKMISFARAQRLNVANWVCLIVMYNYLFKLVVGLFLPYSV